MGFVKLHPKDCARYGAPAEIPFDLAEIGVKQRAAFEKATQKPLKWFYGQLAGVAERDADGNTVTQPVLNDDGTPKLDDDGMPVIRAKLTRDPEAFAMLAWLALWGHGIRVPYDTFDVIEIGLRVDLGSDDDEDVDEGKAPADPPEASPTG